MIIKMKYTNKKIRSRAIQYNIINLTPVINKYFLHLKIKQTIWLGLDKDIF